MEATLGDITGLLDSNSLTYTDEVIVPDVLNSRSFLDKNKRVISRLDELQYPTKFNFFDLDGKIDDFLDTTPVIKIKKINGYAREGNYMRLVNLVKKKLESVPNISADIKTDVLSVLHEYVLNFARYNFDEWNFSNLVGDTLSNQELMKKRQLDFLTRQNLDNDVISKVTDAFESLYENAVRWGNKGDLTKPIRTQNLFLEGKGIVVVQDSGRGFSYETQRKTGFTSRKCSFGGYGLGEIYNQIGLTLDYRNNGNTAILGYIPK